MEQHPGLVTANVAERFLIGWGTPSSAYGGLVEFVVSFWAKRELQENRLLDTFWLLCLSAAGRADSACPGWKSCSSEVV